jgi:hypothetical protein
MTAGGDLDLLHIRALSPLCGRMACCSPAATPGFPANVRQRTDFAEKRVDI